MDIIYLALNWLVIQGLSGVGKAESGREIVRRILKSNIPRPIWHTFVSLSVPYGPPELKDWRDETVGYNMLLDILLQTHASVKPPVLEDPSSVLTKTMKLWRPSSPSSKGPIDSIWILHLDEFQRFGSDKLSALLYGIHHWNMSLLGGMIFIIPLLSVYQFLYLLSSDLKYNE